MHGSCQKINEITDSLIDSPELHSLTDVVRRMSKRALHHTVSCRWWLGWWPKWPLLPLRCWQLTQWATTSSNGTWLHHGWMEWAPALRLQTGLMTLILSSCDAIRLLISSSHLITPWACNYQMHVVPSCCVGCTCLSHLNSTATCTSFICMAVVITVPHTARKIMSLKQLLLRAWWEAWAVSPPNSDGESLD